MQQAGGPAPGEILDVDAWAQEAFGALGSLPGVERVGLALAEGGGRRLLFTASDRSQEEPPDWCHVDAFDDVPLNTAVRTGELVAGSLNGLSRRYPEFVGRQRATEARAVAAVPMQHEGLVLGGFVLFYGRPQLFDEDQRRQLLACARQLVAGLRPAAAERTAPGPLEEDPVAEGARVARHRVPAHPRGAGDARHFLGDTLRDWGIDPDTIDYAALCLSELVTNALVHTHHGCDVRVVLDGGVLTTTVRDNGGPVVQFRPDEEPLPVHGRGLGLVDALASRWGSRREAAGTAVWFDLDT